MQYKDDYNGLIDNERLHFVLQLLMNLLGFIRDPDKKKITYKILELFEADEISIVVADEIVNNHISVSTIVFSACSFP